jgi:hypothetical protein
MASDYDVGTVTRATTIPSTSRRRRAPDKFLDVRYANSPSSFVRKSLQVQRTEDPGRTAITRKGVWLSIVVTATRYPEASRTTSIELAASSSPSRSGSLGDGEGVGVGLGDGGVVGVGVGVGVTVGVGVAVGEGVGVTVGEGDGVAEELGVGLGVSDLKVAGTAAADNPPAGSVPVGVTVSTPVPPA